MLDLFLPEVLAIPNFLAFTSRLAGFIVGIPISAIGLGLILYIRAVRQLECKRSDSDRPDCIFSLSTLLGTKTISIPLNRVYRAEIEQSRGIGSSKEEDILYRVVLHAEQNIVPWTNFYSSDKDSKEKLVEKINAFVRNPDQSQLRIKKVDWVFPFLGFVLIFVGATFILAGVKF